MSVLRKGLPPIHGRYGRTFPEPRSRHQTSEPGQCLPRASEEASDASCAWAPPSPSLRSGIKRQCFGCAPPRVVDFVRLCSVPSRTEPAGLSGISRVTSRGLANCGMGAQHADHQGQAQLAWMPAAEVQSCVGQWVTVRNLARWAGQAARKVRALSHGRRRHERNLACHVQGLGILRKGDRLERQQGQGKMGRARPHRCRRHECKLACHVQRLGRDEGRMKG